MSSRSLNKVQLIGNLTRDPELRYTPTGAAVCTIGLATNRSWTTDSGEKREEVEYHRLIAWNKLAELCSQLLVKGRKIYVEGRLQTRTWQGADGRDRSVTEIVIDDMIILDSRKTVSAGEDAGGEQRPHQSSRPTPSSSVSTPAQQATSVEDIVASQDNQTNETVATHEEAPQEHVNPDDIPF